MEGPEVTFLFQFGNLRDMVTVPASTINLKTLKDLACDFINSKVSFVAFFMWWSLKHTDYNLVSLNNYHSGTREWFEPLIRALATVPSRLQKFKYFAIGKFRIGRNR